VGKEIIAQPDQGSDEAFRGNHARCHGDAAPHGAQRVGEGEPVAVDPTRTRSPVQQRPQRVVDQQVRLPLLADPVRVLLASTTPAPRWWVLSSSSAVSCSHRWAYNAARSRAGWRSQSSNVVISR
jgi:hypothetical protein